MEEPENSLCNSLGVLSYEPWGQKSHRRCQAHVLGITYPNSSSGIYRKGHVRKRCSNQSAAEQWGFPGSYIEPMDTLSWKVM